MFPYFQPIVFIEGMFLNYSNGLQVIKNKNS